MALIRKLFWTFIFVASTFAFTVLFEHGPTDYKENAKKEFQVLKEMATSKPARRKDESEKLTPPTH